MGDLGDDSKLWLTKKTRNTDSLTSEFHSGSKKRIDYPSINLLIKQSGFSVMIFQKKNTKNAPFSPKNDDEMWNSYSKTFLENFKEEKLHKFLRRFIFCEAF